ncbi:MULTISPECIES: RNA polymerase sigma factor [unclassified Pseudomonas]|uniref:RNA polymerase sigma factor n=1 Tax=unclassified Pseudomonas TaxID=196821 RepID=UPI002114E01B|nr:MULTISPECIES: RNA polymerase sigma factor [unclassified Pseudomonas]MCU1725084.1 RNA polymerase sigma factor [Pseudomonas sp. 5P_5.1_Bac1]MCU1732335.1 RNA polymerase sigma factor [Pseudomonas sp. 20P_3.2_Bac4]MCU1746652.1 RNA polymerase sigma factor [Pseudomonas sp. 20P_3.2_Bac5]
MSSMTTEELERAFKAHARELRVFLYRQLQSTETAADLAQETYLRMLSQRPRKPVDNLRAFIFRIGRNLVIDHVRSRASRERHDQGLAYLFEVTGESPELIDTVAASQELEALNAAWQRMDEPAKSIFLMCRLQGMAHKDVARELGVSLSTVEKSLAGALDFLRRSLQR